MRQAENRNDAYAITWVSLCKLRSLSSETAIPRLCPLKHMDYFVRDAHTCFSIIRYQSTTAAKRFIQRFDQARSPSGNFSFDRLCKRYQPSIFNQKPHSKSRTTYGCKLKFQVVPVLDCLPRFKFPAHDSVYKNSGKKVPF